MTDSPYDHGTVLVSTTPTYIGGEPIIETGSPGILLKNNGPVTVFLGSDTVTAECNATAESNGIGGLQLVPGETLLVPGSGTRRFAIYGVTASDTALVTYLGI